MVQSPARLRYTPPGAASLPLLGLAVYIVTSIFYVFPSGTPQPADWLLLLAIVATLLFVWKRLPNEGTLYIVASLLLMWIVLVNAYWYLVVGHFLFVKKTTFYIYNMIVFLFVVAAGFHDFERLKRAVWWSCIVSILAQLFLLEFLPATTKRATSTFNNPNQMGYWALLAMTCLAISKDRARLGLLDVLALCAGMYISLHTISLASIISSIVLIIIVVPTSGCHRQAGWLLAAVIAGGLVLQVATGRVLEPVTNLAFVDRLTRDLDAIGDTGDEDILKRGYRRLILYPQYLAFGAGEGAFERLATGRVGGEDKEFHSSLGNLTMSYGLVGLALFLLLLAVVFARAPWASILYLGPIMLYGITHMGLRDSLFWVFLGLVYAQARYGRKPNSVARSAVNLNTA